ncbi:transposase [soil metagenome]
MQRIFLSEAQKKAGWHERSYIPHYDAKGITQFVTFRLNDSLPATCLRNWESELVAIDWRDSNNEQAANNQRDSNNERRALIEEYLDKGAGEKSLEDPRIANIVATALLQFNQDRYRLHAWVVMPNHVHVLFSPNGSTKLAEIIRSWKGYSGRMANRILGRTGAFWQRDYHDRFIRDAQHFFTSIKYIEDNPVKAGLCKKAEDWEFSSAGYRCLGRPNVAYSAESGR